MSAQQFKYTQVSSRPVSSPLINGLPNMNGIEVDGKIMRGIESQVEEDEKKNKADPCWDCRRFIKLNEYNDWRWDWLCNKMINENKVVLDDLDLQEFRQFANKYLKPVKPQVNRKN